MRNVLTLKKKNTHVAERVHWVPPEVFLLISTNVLRFWQEWLAKNT